MWKSDGKLLYKQFLGLAEAVADFSNEANMADFGSHCLTVQENELKAALFNPLTPAVSSCKPDWPQPVP
ncbi:MAG: hypothetical protein V1793_19090, partial [Pseudomonadota bacterium]